MPAFSKGLETVLHSALELANVRKHEFATLEHLLLALTEDQDAKAVIDACNVDMKLLRDNLTGYIDNDLSGLVMDTDEDCKPTAGFQRVIQRAVIHVQSSGRDEVTGANVLVALFAERESHAAYFLQEQDMTRYDAVNFIAHGVSKKAGSSNADMDRENDDAENMSRIDYENASVGQVGGDFNNFRMPPNANKTQMGFGHASMSDLDNQSIGGGSQESARGKRKLNPK